MSIRAQRRLFLAAGTLLGLVLLWGLGGLPDVGVYRGPYGDVVTAAAVAERQAANVVGAVTFDVRAVDTLVEEFILLTAVLGVAVLLRAERGETAGPARDAAEGRRAPTTSSGVRAPGLLLVGTTVLLGLSVVAHGHVSPGGGFQGGLILATGALLVYLAGGYATLQRVRPQPVIELAEATGAGGFVVVGLAGMAAGSVFLANVLPLGQLGSLASAGTVPALNLTVGLEVAAAFVLLLSELLEQVVVRHRQRQGHGQGDGPAGPKDGGGP